MKYLSWFCFWSLLLISCVDQKDYSLSSLDVNPSVSIPLAHGSVSIKDFLSSKDSSYIKTGTDGLLSLVYSKQLISQQIRGLFSIPNTNTNISINVPAIPLAIAVPQDVTWASQSTVVDLGISPAQLSEISFKSGLLTLSTSLSPTSDINYEVIVSLPDFTSKSTNQPLLIQGKGTLTVQLADYILKLNSNKFTANVSFVLKKSSTPVSIGANTKAISQLSLTGMDFNYIKGFLGDQSVSISSSTLNIGAYGNSLNKASVSLAQPNVNLVILNDYGIPLTINFVTLEARKANANPVSLTLNPANPVPLISPSVLGTFASTSVSITNSSQVLNYAPSQLYYQATASINKGLVAGNNFLADTSKIRVNLNVNIPLYGHASGISLGDTVAVDLSTVNQSQVTDAALKIKITNEIPLDGKVQFYLTDDKYVVIDSLLSTSQTSFIKGSSVTASGDLQSAGLSDQTLTLDNTKLNKIFTSKHIIIKAQMSTSKDSNGNFIDSKFKSQYKMTLDAGISAKLNFNVKL